MKIKEAVLTEPRKIEIAEREITPGPGEALVRIEACGYCMTDFGVYDGRDPDAELPMVLGHESAGVVVETNPGPGDKELAVGARVTGAFSYAFATYAVAPINRLYEFSDEVPFEHAQGEPLACVVNVAKAARPRIGNHVLQVGCGAMGLMLLMYLARTCTRSLIAVDINVERLKLAKEIGVTHAINPAECNAKEAILDITCGRGVDIAIEFTGKPVGFELCSTVLKYGGARMLVPGSHMVPATYNLWPLMLQGASIDFVHPAFSEDFDGDLQLGLYELERGVFQMDKIVTHRYTFDNVAQGFEMARTAEDGYIKGVFLPQD